MKKSIFLFALLSLSTISFSQWTTSGNNIYNSNSGNVGIGVTTPTVKLHANGDLKFGSSTGGYFGAAIEWYTSDWGNGFGHKIYNSDPGGRTDLRIAARHNTATWTDVMTITSDGKVGVGTTNPIYAFEVSPIARFQAPVNTNANIIIQGGQGSGYQAWWLTGGNGIFKIGGNGSTEPSEGAINIDWQGNVSVGTTNSYGYKLAVNGSAIFTSAKVKLYSNWPDYVFYQTYELPSLASLEKFIKINNHLPNIPSAQEINDNGIDLGDMSGKLLEKIEELTLYIIELKKENEKMQAEINKIKSRK